MCLIRSLKNQLLWGYPGSISILKLTFSIFLKIASFSTKRLNSPDEDKIADVPPYFCLVDGKGPNTKRKVEGCFKQR